MVDQRFLHLIPKIVDRLQSKQENPIERLIELRLLIAGFEMKYWPWIIWVDQMSSMQEHLQKRGYQRDGVAGRFTPMLLALKMEE